MIRSGQSSEIAASTLQRLPFDAFSVSQRVRQRNVAGVDASDLFTLARKAKKEIDIQLIICIRDFNPTNDPVRLSTLL